MATALLLNVLIFLTAAVLVVPIIMAMGSIISLILILNIFDVTAAIVVMIILAPKRRKTTKNRHTQKHSIVCAGVVPPELAWSWRS